MVRRDDGRDRTGRTRSVIVVIPLAGRGARFASEGVETPKPFIDVGGEPMLSWAFRSVAALPYSRAVFVALRRHSQRFGLAALASSLAGSRASVVEINDVTEGQLCTVLAAREFLDTDEDLLVASADTVVVSGLAADVETRDAACRGLISVARLPGDRWSFVQVDESGRAVRVAEKERISDLASTGLYYFSSARELAAEADAMIAARETTRGEYYVIPVYQRYIASGREVRVSEASEVWDMGNPDALREFQAHLARG